MKRCNKLNEPPSLATYRNAQPNSTWEAMKDDPWHGGQQAYHEIKQTLVQGQRGLCAYCELRITKGFSETELDASRPEQRVEHFHPKSDQNPNHNWALDWSNLWAVCHGGSQAPLAGLPANASTYLEPLAINLSCDAHKDQQITLGKLASDPKGYLLAPNDVVAFPQLFQFAPDGAPEACLENCATVVIPNNRYADTATLVSRTIEHLNLGCNRLNRNRSKVKGQLIKQIELLRKRAKGESPQNAMLKLARRIFSSDTNTLWPEYFTFLRWSLGKSAEEHLKSVQFMG